MLKVLRQVAQDTRREIAGVLWLALSIVLYLALAGRSEGALGGSVAKDMRIWFGWEAWWIPALIGLAGVFRLINRPSWTGQARSLAVVLLTVVTDAMLGLFHKTWSGTLGYTLGHETRVLLGQAGALVILLALMLACVLVASGGSLAEASRLAGRAALWSLSAVGASGLRFAHSLRDWVFPMEGQNLKSAGEPPKPLSHPVEPDRPDRPDPVVSPRQEDEERSRPPVKAPTLLPHPAASTYAPPPLDLLAAPPGSRPGRRGRSAQERGELLVATLHQFGIEARLGEVSQGPAVTRFEVMPPPGVKVSKIVNLADDIALSLAATAVRMEAPIPGKSAIGIEVANEEISTVWLREVLESSAFRDGRSPLTVALGKDIAGQPVVAALDAMPHLLVAGATGSGKSVLINALISSLLFRAGPQLVRLLLIDPKVVELSGYNGIPHLLTPVVTDPKKASQALRWAVKEMERRYQLFAQSSVRDMSRYNLSASERLPYIVVIIDELADLMMVAPVEVEESIARLAQMARAAGIHLVVATQRPSVDVITGTIKANIPSRIAFAVSSQVDSRTILDGAGAEKLLGRGDMLFDPVGAPKPMRIQGVLVQESEIEAIVQVLRSQAPPPQATVEFLGDEEAKGMPRETDALFEEALRIVVESRQASASMLQRRLRVGYTRAARLIDAMAERGYVGPADGARARDVYLTHEQFHRLFDDAANTESQ